MEVAHVTRDWGTILKVKGQCNREDGPYCGGLRTSLLKKYLLPVCRLNGYIYADMVVVVYSISLFIMPGP